VEQELGNPFRVGLRIVFLSLGSALNARNPGLRLVNAFGVLDYSSFLLLAFRVDATGWSSVLIPDRGD